jgi:hypothetical protein
VDSEWAYTFIELFIIERQSTACCCRDTKIIGVQICVGLMFTRITNMEILSSKDAAKFLMNVFIENRAASSKWNRQPDCIRERLC